MADVIALQRVLRRRSAAPQHDAVLSGLKIAMQSQRPDLAVDLSMIGLSMQAHNLVIYIAHNDSNGLECIPRQCAKVFCDDRAAGA